MDSILDKDIRAAAKRAWYSWDESVNSDAVDDVSQELWFEYLTKPSTKRLMDESPSKDRQNMLTRMAHRHFASMVESDSVADGQTEYSVEDVKAALKGEAKSEFLSELLSKGLIAIGRRHTPYHDALRGRYLELRIPQDDFTKNQLKNAHVAITEEVNKALRNMHSPPEEYYACTDKPFKTIDDSHKMRNPVEAGSRKSNGDISKPTEDLALALLDNPEEMRDLFETDTAGINTALKVESESIPLNIFDSEFNGAPRVDQYRGFVCPDIYPFEKDITLANWSDDDADKELFRRGYGY